MAVLPGWDSLKSVTQIHHWLEIAGIVFLALLVLSEAFAFGYNSRKDELVGASQRAADEARGQSEQQAEQRRRSEVESLQSRLAEAARAAGEAIATVQAAQSPRRLSEEQKRLLAEALVPFRGQRIDIYCVIGDGEGKRYARDFVELLRSIEWNDGGGTGINEGGGWSSDPVGVEVHMNDAETRTGRIPQSVQALVGTLSRLGLLVEPSKIWRNTQVTPDRIRLIIGHKPIAADHPH